MKDSFDVNASNPDITNTTGSNFVTSSRTQYTSNMMKENIFEHTTNTTGECLYNIATPAPLTPSLRISNQSLTNSDKCYTTSYSGSKDNVDYGDLTYICSACGAKLWHKETKVGKQTNGFAQAFSLCCLKGKITLPEFNKSPPKLIWDLYTNNHPKSQHFIENVRQYNMIFAFTSMGGKVGDRVNKTRGPYTFYTWSKLSPIWSVKNRTKASSSCYSLDEDLICQLMEVLDEDNHLVKMFQMARDRFLETTNMQMKIKLIGRRTIDGRNYNLPTVDELAALIVGDINVSSYDERDIIIDSRIEGLKRISELHPEYLALQYPLLFIYAEDGYRTDILRHDVDEHSTRVKKRAERISYIRKNQNILRADTFTNLMNSAASGSSENSMMGNRIKPPSSFTGSARYMIENYRYAMALCRVFGYPDLFLTFTCNPKWPEITRVLMGTGFKAEDKPSFCSRMFKMKLDQLMKDIRKKNYLVLLKQKRGLLHDHICLFLDERNKMPQPEDVDKYIFAEIPDEINEPELYQLVFPKPFSDVTKTDEDGYLIYRRRDDGRTWCNQVASISYLFKYINKAIWRILKFDIHHHYPGVIRLPFHLEGQQQIIFDEEELIDEVLEKPSVNTSMFIEWMNCNVCNQEARELTYVEFPTKFIWNKDNRSWIRHKRNTGAIGHIHHVAPASSDLFFLRILLNKVFNSYRDSCNDLGLLDDDKEYIKVVFEKTFRYLSVDIVHPHRTETQIEIELLKDLTLQEIEKLIQRNSSTLRSFSSMPCPSNHTRNISKNRLIIDELSYEKSKLANEHSDFITKLTSEQTKKTLSVALCSKGEIVLNVASSEIAALLLSRGRTAHSRFHIPLHPTDESFCTISTSNKLGELIRRIKLLIWDEAPMVNKMCIEALNHSMHDICRQSNTDSMDTLFRGKIVVFSGDFRQILPVIQKGKREDIVDASLNSSYFWDYVTVLKLTVNI
ncbi:uncharacterized protein [Rutidosis leptorrhynchoides]|uniref:uncharacterized protein n=1 Tax=Rutidosis leptorrhynchoides TaxID=125765 RepID=UPI003A9A4EFB